MTLTDLSIFMSATTPALCGVLAGRPAGVTGASAGFAIGVVIGIMGCWGVRKLIKRTTRHPDLGKETTQFWRVLVSLWVLVVFLWIPISGFLTIFITDSLIRHVAA